MRYAPRVRPDHKNDLFLRHIAQSLAFRILSRKAGSKMRFSAIVLADLAAGKVSAKASIFDHK